jgi:hypothetical protein
MVQDRFMTDRASGTDNGNHPPMTTAKTSRFTSFAMSILREPLTHFLVLGSLLFAIYAYSKRDTTAGSERLVVSAGKVEHLASIFSRTWQRPPNATELKGLVDDYVREEIAYREGLKLGLDQDDTIIRRRIRQKMDFIADDLTSEVEPTEEDLASFLMNNRNAYLADSKWSFKQVFLDPERHVEDLDKTAVQLLKALQSDSADPRESGDRTLLEHQFRDLPRREVVGIFGDSFAEKLNASPIQQWTGPIASAYGIHLVFIEDRIDGREPTLDEVRPMVLRDWERERRAELAESFYQGLLRKYNVAIDWPEPTTDKP